MNNHNEQQITALKSFLFEEHTIKKTNQVSPPVLVNRNICVPAYQRPYSWKKEHISQLLNDFKACIDNDSDEYFIGNIMLMILENDIPIKYEIVDGQQRLTSIFLILVWLNNHLIHDRETHIIFEQVKNNFHLSHRHPDEKILDEIKNIADNKKILKFLAKKDKNETIFYNSQLKVFSKIFNEINRYFYQEFLNKNDVEGLNKFAYFLLKKVCCLLIIDSPSNDFADTLFLSLNGKGLKLDQVDLIKSFFIQPFINDGMTEEFKDKWASIIVNTENKLKKSIIEYLSRFKIRPSKLSSDLQKVVSMKNDSIKKWFNSMWNHFKNYKEIFDAKTKSHEFNFYIKLFNKFKYTKYGQILSPLCSLFESNTNDLIHVMKLLFKLNFLYVGLSKTTAAVFNKEVINPCIAEIKKAYDEEQNNNELNQNIKNALKEISKILSEKCSTALDGNNPDLNLMSDFNINNYSYKDRKEIIYFARLLLTNNNSKNDSFDFENMESLFDRELDHVIPKSGCILEKDAEYNNIYKLIERYGPKNELVKFNFSINDLFDDETKEEYDIKNAMSYQKFLNFINMPFNLEICTKSLNRKQGNRTSHSIQEIKSRFSKNFRLRDQEKMNDAIKFFFYERSDSSKNIMECWLKLMKISRPINNFSQQFLKDNENHIQMKIIEDISNKDILSRDEIDFFHQLRKKRNEIQHEKFESKNQNLTSDEFNKFKKIYDKLENYLNNNKNI